MSCQYVKDGVSNLMVTAVPNIVWRGPADVLAVGAYLSGVMPLFAISLLELASSAGARPRMRS